MERWVLLRKGADFEAIGKKYQISPRLACLIRNRDVIGEEAVDRYLNGTISDLYDGMLMKDMDKAIDILKEKILEDKKIRVIGLTFCWKDWNVSVRMWTVIYQTVSVTDMD